MSGQLAHRPARRLLRETTMAVSSASAVVGIGLDLTDIHEVRGLISEGGHSFLNDTWTPAEQNDVGLDHRRLAGRWAVKEAVMKALGVGLGEVAPLDIEVRTQESGALSVVLHRSARRAARSRGITTWHASLSYGGQWALGVAVGVLDGSEGGSSSAATRRTEEVDLERAGE